MEIEENLKDSLYYIDKNDDGLWYWYLLSGESRKVATSAESYRNLDECKVDIEFVKMTKDVSISVLDPNHKT